jgi:formate hydrogenlyase subunit 4
VNGIVAVIIAVLVYPGALVALAAALLLSWGRTSVRAAVSGTPLPDPLRDIREVRGSIERDAIVPESAYGVVLGSVSTLALLLPIAALVLLPLPGNPLVDSIGLQGDLAAEGGLLLGVPLLRIFVGWAIPSPYTRLAADRGARLLAGALAPIVLALVTVGEQLSSLQLKPSATAGAPLAAIDLITRLLAALAFVFALPVLARVTSLHGDGPEPELPAGELAEVSGRDLARFRVAEALQLVAVAALFATAFILPLFPRITGSGRTILWTAALIVTALGIGAWDGLAGRLPTSEDRPPLSWWLGIPVLVGLLALVAAAWAARGT